MTLDGIMADMLHYFTEFGTFGVNNIKVVDVTPILSVAKMWFIEPSFQ